MEEGRVDKMRCQDCKKELEDKARFCKYCGSLASNKSRPKVHDPKGMFSRVSSSIKAASSFIWKHDWIIILSLLIIAFSFRFFLRPDCVFHMDATGYSNAAKATFDTLTMHYALSPGYPGNILISAILYGFDKILLGATDADNAVIMTSIILASLSIPLLYITIKKWFKNRKIALFTALLYCFTPLFLSVSTWGKDHGASAFFTILTFYFMIRFKEKKDILSMVLVGISYGYTVCVRMPDMLIIIPLTLIYLDISIKGFRLKDLDFYPPRLKEIFAFVASSTAVIIALYYTLLTTEGLKPFFDQMAYNKFLGLFSPQLYLGFQWITSGLLLYGWIFAILGIIYLLKSKDYILVSNLVIWFMALFIFMGSRTTTSPRYFITALIPLMILSGFGLFWLSRMKIKQKSIAPFISVMFIVMIIHMLVIVYPVMSYRHSYCGPKEFGEFLKEKTEPDSLILAVDEHAFIHHFGEREYLIHPVNEEYADENAWIDFKEKIDSHLDSGKHVYFISTFFSYDDYGLAYKMIMENYDAEYIGEVDNEDFHKSEITPAIFTEQLYRIKKK